MYHETEGWCKIKRKADLRLEKSLSQKSKNLHFDRILLSKAYKDLHERELEELVS